jgi:hypothetical protein
MQTALAAARTARVHYAILSALSAHYRVALRSVFDVAIITPRRDLYCASMGAPAHAQQPYPIKTIRMIVPFAPDGIGQH